MSSQNHQGGCVSIGAIVGIVGLVISLLNYRNDLYKQRLDYAKFLSEREINLRNSKASWTYRPILYNLTGSRITCAIHYQDYDGEWITRGWYKIDPYEKAHVHETVNRNFYIYAKADNWWEKYDGENSGLSKEREVSSDKFYYIDSYPSNSWMNYSVSFYHNYLENSRRGGDCIVRIEN